MDARMAAPGLPWRDRREPDECEAPGAFEASETRVAFPWVQEVGSRLAHGWSFRYLVFRPRSQRGPDIRVNDALAKKLRDF
jgi:hypothetical protein